MKNLRDTNFKDFNKELLCGEIGAILGAAIISALISRFTGSRNIIATFAIVGSIMGGGTLLILDKIRNKIKRGEPIWKSILYDLKYFTPAAAVIAIFICYPLLYHLMKDFISEGWSSFRAGATSEAIGFVVFFGAINIYRFSLIKLFNKNIA